MRSFKFVLAAAVVAAVAVHTPVAQAQTMHVVGAGSSAQFLGTMIGMSQLAQNNLAGGQCIYHWTKKNAMNAHDNRDKLNRIIDETGTVGIVWDAACSDGSGNTNISDVWMDGQYDSTLGVRLFSAQQISGAGSGATVYLTGVSAGTPSDNLVSPSNLWADNKSDVALPASLLTFIGGSAPGTFNVNVGLTDIRPEDALAATKRTLAALNTTTWAGLGYVGPTSQIGAPIYTAQSGSTSNFTPIGFGLSGAKDPINTAATVPAYTTIPVGAAPIVFAYNNAGTFKSSLADFTTGVIGNGTKGAATTYLLAHLFDGTTSCDTNNPAFTGGGDGTGTPITLILREPLSGTMNTTEYSLFRSFGTSTDSQEAGIINPTRAPYNPLNLACGSGSRQRRIGTGQVLSAISGTAHTLGYFFFSFANSASAMGNNVANQGNFNYMTLDGVDPLGIKGTVNQELPFCSATLCPATTWWTGGVSFPTLRNGTYKAWSLYRWTVYTSNHDPLGPAALAQSMQDNIDSTVADFVPFVTSSNSDGLEVYHSHFTQSAVACGYTVSSDAGKECNGNQSPTEALTDGNSLGGGPEAGGDEGGVVIGWDHSTVTVANQTTGACAGLSKVTKTAGRTFGFSGTNAAHTAGNPVGLEGLTVTINGNPATVSSCIAPTPAVLYVTPRLTAGTAQSFSVYIAPTANFGGTPIIDGVLGKKQ